jgi:hypothetical protein
MSQVAMDERERLLIEAVVTLARTLRDERDRLAERLREVERDLTTLTERLDPGPSRRNISLNQ